MKALFNPYTPKPINLEYPDTQEPEISTERASMPEADAYALFELIVAQLMPDECPVTFVEEDGVKCLCNQFEMISYETEILELAEAQMPKSGRYIFAWLHKEELTLDQDPHQQRMDEIMEKQWEQYNLTW